MPDPPPPGEIVQGPVYGPPQVRIPTRQGSALVWLLRAADSFFVAVTIADTTPYWGDDFVLSLNTSGRGGDRPGHDDFQWYLRRTLDSTVIYRGRAGRWEAPRGDPDWRLGAERSGGGWEVSARDDKNAWHLVLRLDPAWLAGTDGRLPRIAFRVYDDSPGGWFAWPVPVGKTPAEVEQSPDDWAPIR